MNKLNPKLQSEIEYTVGFNDLDIMQIVWHGHYHRLFELARTQLMKDINLDWPVLAHVNIGMPIIRSQIEYRKPIRYHSNIKIEVKVYDLAQPVFETHYQIFDINKENSSQQLIASSKITQSYVKMPDMEVYFHVPEEISEVFSKCI